MFCPTCRTGYPDGVSRCPSCDVDLVATLEPEAGDVAEWVAWVTVYESLEASRISVVRSLLEAEQIPCVIPDEQARLSLGLLSAPGPLGPLQIQVPPELAEAARALIADRSSELAEDSDLAGPSA